MMEKQYLGIQKAENELKKTHNSISNVLTNSKEVYVLCRENDRNDVVIVYSKDGELLGELHNTDMMYINYMQNHPRYEDDRKAERCRRRHL